MVSTRRRGAHGRRTNKGTDPCNICGKLGHWANECDQRKAQHKGVSRQVGPPVRVYVMAKFRRRPIHCLLDSGCERSIIGRRFVQNVRLKKTWYILSAANGTDLPVDGDTDIYFTIQDQTMAINVSVCPVIDELILGSDWLSHHKCRWDFGEGTIIVDEHTFQTHRRENLPACRRIFVTEECVVPPRHEANVPIRMMCDDIHCPKSDWAVEPRVVQPCVVAARTLVSDDSTEAVAWVLNYSDEPYTFTAERFLSLAEPVSAADGQDNIESTSDGTSATGRRGNTAPATRDGTSGRRKARAVKRRQHGRRDELQSKRSRSSTVEMTASESGYEHIKCLLERLPDDLTPAERTGAEEFIKSKAHIFSKSEFDIGRTDILKHRVDTGDNPPYFEALRRHPTTQLPSLTTTSKLC